MSFMIVEHCIHLFSCNYHPLLNPNMYFTHTTSPTPTHSPPYIALDLLLHGHRHNKSHTATTACPSQISIN